MKKTILSFIVSLFVITGTISAQQTLTVTHNATGDMAAELTAALGSTVPTTIATLAITGNAYLNFADCGEIIKKFPTIDLKTLDLSGAKFENDSIPSNAPSSTVGAFNSADGTSALQVTEVKLPASLKIIGARAFRKFSKLTTINLPASLTKICEGAFTACSSINLASLPASVKTIEGYAFYQDYAMKDLTELPEGLQGIIGASAFAQTSVAISYIPVGVTQIANNAFSAGSRTVFLESLTVYQNLDSIGVSTFGNQAKLTSIEVNRMTPPRTSATAFSGVTIAAIDLYIPIGTEAAYNKDPWKSMLIHATLPAISGISEIKKLDLRVYPNPATDMISVSLSDKSTIKTVRILDITGKILNELTPNESLSFDVSMLSRGMYFLQINKDTFAKFIKN